MTPGSLPGVPVNTIEEVTPDAVAPTSWLPAPGSDDSQSVPHAVAAGGPPDGLRITPASTAQPTYDAQPLFQASRVQPAERARAAVSPVEIAGPWSVGQSHALRGGAATSLSDFIFRPGQASLPADPLAEPRWTRVSAWVDEAVGARVALDDAAWKETAPACTTSGPVSEAT